MRYERLILASEEIVKHFRWDMTNLDVEVLDTFTEEVIDFVLDYAADRETARGSIGEFINEAVDLYSTHQIATLERFKEALESFCYALHQLLLETDAWNDQNELSAKFDRFLGDDIVLRRMTEDELAATGTLTRAFNL